MQITGKRVDKLEQQIEESLRRLKALLYGSNQLSTPQKNMLVEALDELSQTLQDLQVAKQEMQTCNDELSTTRLAVEAERRRYQELFEFAPDGYLVTDGDGIILEANQAAANLLNVERDRLLGESLVIFVAESESTDFLNQIHQLPSREIIQDWEVLIQPWQFPPFPGAFTAAPVRNTENQVVGWRWLLKDITIRKQYKAALVKECHNLEKQVQQRTTELLAANQQLQRLNLDLEKQVSERTAALQKSLELQAMLQWITVEIRDSIQEEEILKLAVQELIQTLGIVGGDAAVYNIDNEISTIIYQYPAREISEREKIVKMASWREGYHQLLENKYFQFCEIVPGWRGRMTILACPMIDSQGVLGDLRLFKAEEDVFTDYEIFLVQQVANQCAIAIRQARLYEAVQAQVTQLEQISRLKDEFLSTVSHELRTPVSNMKMAIQMLGIMLNREQDLSGELSKPQPEQNKLARYFQILQNECEREITLINDVLDLQRLDMGNQNLVLTAINLSEWVPKMVEPFQVRAQKRCLSLEVNIADNIPNFICDRASLERIISELLNNACKYTPPGEKIIISVQTQPGIIQLTISNTGIEIPANQVDRIFERFYRIPSADPWKQGGTGLGLALVQKLIVYLKGKIEVISENEVTNFIVSLPINS